MNILFIHSLMSHKRTWRRAAERLSRDGIELFFASQAAASARLAEHPSDYLDLLVAESAMGLSGADNTSFYQECQVLHRMGLGAEIPAAFTTFSDQDAADFRPYLESVDVSNYVNGVRFLAALTGFDVAFDPPVKVRTTGIYHPDADSHFYCVDEYRNWLVQRTDGDDAPCVGLLFYYSQWVEENTADVDAVIHTLESHGLAPMCVFSPGAEDAADTAPDGPPWLKLFLQPPGVKIVLSMMAGRLLKRGDQSFLLEQLDVPVIQLLRSHHQTPDQWRDDPRGLAAITTVYSLTQPETFGVSAPVMTAGSVPDDSSDPSNSVRTFVPVQERIDTLCRRVQRWIHLGRLANRDKRVTFVLHNNPCKGVEATVGMAVGMDTFESLARVLQQMDSTGYDVGRPPDTGRELLDMIMDRKAEAEFRWTTVDEIVAKGGALHMMDHDEYGPWFDRLPEAARGKVLEDWSAFPGQSMAYKEDGADLLVITGIQYGNVRIMVQPKRGCYGPKCNGEVCRILHDPQLAPPHHWLATYKYIQDHSDAVVHFGTEGALEYLPGKQTALSHGCFPEITIGDLPNLYVYVMDATGEGLTAKRRGQAILVDHMTPVYRPAPLDEKTRQVEGLLEQYRKALAMGDNGRSEAIGGQLAPLLAECGLVETAPTLQTLPEVVSTVRRQIVKIRRSLMPEGLHRLSAPPGKNGVAQILVNILQSPPPGLPDVETIATWLDNAEKPIDDLSSHGQVQHERDPYERAASVLKRLITDQPVAVSSSQSKPLVDFSKGVAARIAKCDMEIAQLLRGLSGKYIPPGLSGSLSRGQIDALPTGKNFFATDVTVLPTAAAWEIGQQMADRLLLKYWNEEQRFPESIGISIWSSDAFKSDGELLCQIFALMGVRPVWDSRGKVGETRPIDLKDLLLTFPNGRSMQRPRVDVTIQTSSLMRDLVPNFCDLLDRAVVMVSRLDEPVTWNFIRKHAHQQMDRLLEQTGEALSEAQLRRMTTLRIFSSAPGAYGLGVGLALDASAWQDRKDLAEVYINWGGHAYSADDGEHAAEYGLKAQQLLADQMTRVDVTYMKQASAEYDVLDCGYYAVFQGGMATAAEAAGDKKPKLYWGDSTQPANAEVGDLSDEINRSARAKLLNPAWIKHMRSHGYQGAQNAASRVNNLFKWSATSDQVSKRLYDDVVRTYIMNEENRAWLREDNPYALEEISRRLLEASSRNLWQAEDELLAAVQSAALEIEGDMEEIMGDVDGEFQGGKVEVLTHADVDLWDMKWRLGDG